MLLFKHFIATITFANTVHRPYWLDLTGFHESTVLSEYIFVFLRVSEGLSILLLYSLCNTELHLVAEHVNNPSG